MDATSGFSSKFDMSTLAENIHSCSLQKCLLPMIIVYIDINKCTITNCDPLSQNPR